MARNHERDGIRSTGTGHGTSGPRLPDGSRDVAVGTDVAIRNVSQALPNAFLERRPPDVDRQLAGHRLSVKKCQDPSGPVVQTLVMAQR